jgi:hypothetical protein
VALLQRLAVVTLRVGQTEQTLLEEVTEETSEHHRQPEGAITYSSPFQKAKATFCRPWESQTPAMPSSPQRKARERAMSWVKSGLRQ